MSDLWSQSFLEYLDLYFCENHKLDLQKTNHSLVINDIAANYFAAKINKGWGQKLSSHPFQLLCKYETYFRLKFLGNKVQVVNIYKIHHHIGCSPVKSDDSFRGYCLNICMADGDQNGCTCIAKVLPSSSVSNDW